MAYCTEKEVMDMIYVAAKTIDIVPVVFVSRREPVKGNPYQYHAVFAVQTSENNEQLIAKLLFLGDNIEFGGSEVDVQGGNVILDFIYVRAIISPKIGE